MCAKDRILHRTSTRWRAGCASRRIVRWCVRRRARRGRGAPWQWAWSEVSTSWSEKFRAVLPAEGTYHCRWHTACQCSRDEYFETTWLGPRFADWKYPVHTLAPYAKHQMPIPLTFGISTTPVGQPNNEQETETHPTRCNTASSTQSPRD
jgi:hypothetical protein